MPPELISKRTRLEFREYLVNYSVREIKNLFDAAEIDCIDLSPEKLGPSVRRNTVSEYYASIDWTSPTDVRRVLSAYENILMEIPETLQPSKKHLLRLLGKDGYTFENDRLVSKSFNFDLSEISNSTNTLDTSHLGEHIERIKKSIDVDPALAIGSTKELLEATLKTILAGLSISFDKNDDIPKLLKKVQIGLKLSPSDVEEAAKGAEIIRRVLGSLSTIVVGTAELRNLYGTGHGSGTKRKGLRERHARLVVSMGAALCSFLLETFEVRHKESK